MGTRHPNYRRIKSRRTYTVDELARTCGVHKNTVRAWRKAGLKPIDEGRPVLFRGDAAAAFLKERRAKAKQPCGPGRLYCLRCRSPKEPAAGMLDYIAATATLGALAGLCPTCSCMMFRRVARVRIASIAGSLDVQFSTAEASLRE